MNLFVLTYDRRRRMLVGTVRFAPGEYEQANRLLSETELRDPDLEVVLLVAGSLDDLKRTHGRYFDDPTQPLLEAAG